MLTDKRGIVWIVDVEKGAPPVKVDQDPWDIPEPVWSPDSRWLAYSKVLASQFAAVFAYSLETRTALQLTDGLGDARFPAFDRGGKYLYFAASTDLGPVASPGSMAGMNRPLSRAVYAVVLRKDLAVPARAGERRGKAGRKEGRDEEGSEGRRTRRARTTRRPPRSVTVTIDPERIGQRTLALPIPAENYTALAAGKEGQLFLVKDPRVNLVGDEGPATSEVVRFDLEKRKTETLVSGIAEWSLAAGGEKLLYKKGDSWFVAGCDAPAKAGEGELKVAEAQVYVDPRAEWRQMYRETWRIERDFLYDPGFHGLDLAAAEATLRALGRGSAAAAAT